MKAPRIEYCRTCKCETVWKPGRALVPAVAFGVPSFAPDRTPLAGQLVPVRQQEDGGRMDLLRMRKECRGMSDVEKAVEGVGP